MSLLLCHQLSDDHTSVRGTSLDGFQPGINEKRLLVLWVAKTKDRCMVTPGELIFSTNVARKQCSLVCPSSWNMARKQCSQARRVLQCECFHHLEKKCALQSTIHYLAINSDRSVIDCMNPEDSRLRGIDDWCSHQRTKNATIWYRECSTIHFFDCKGSVTCLV